MTRLLGSDGRRAGRRDKKHDDDVYVTNARRTRGEELIGPLLIADHPTPNHHHHQQQQEASMRTPTAAGLLLLAAAAAAVADAFVAPIPATAPIRSNSGSSRRTVDGAPRSLHALAKQPQHRPPRSSSLRMMQGAVEAVSPLLLAQLAGCAALVGAGKVLLKQEEEEGIEPAAPW